MDKTTQIVQDFIKEGGFGEELQNRLITYDKTQPNSWVMKNT